MSGMDSVRLLVITCIAILTSVEASWFNTTVCKPVTHNYGYIPPDPPYSYIIKYRETDLLTKKSFIRQVYFDMENQRILHKQRTQGKSSRLVLNYKQGVSFEVDEGHYDFWYDITSCSIKPLENKWDATMGFQMLDYGLIKYRQLNESHDVRGIPAEQFTGCLYDDDLRQTLKVTYSFTVKDQDYFSAFGREGAFSQTAEGEYYNAYYGTWRPVSVRRDIFWYDTNPYFRDEDFQIPPQIFCDTRMMKTPRLTLDIQFPSYTAKQETSVQYMLHNKLTQDMNHYNVWISAKHQVTREDYYTNDCKHAEGKIFCNTRIKAIHDFVSDLGYVINTQTNECQVVPLSTLKSDPDITSKGGFIRMAGMSSILEDHTFIFAMRETYRDMPVKMYMTDFTKETVAGRAAISTLELFFLDETWEDETFNKMKGQVPVRYRKQVNFQDDKEPKEMTILSNMYNVNEQEPPLAAFHQYYCFRGLPYKTFTYSMKAKSSGKMHQVDDEQLQGAKDAFQVALSKAAGMRFLNINLIELFLTSKGLQGYATFYDTPNVTSVSTTGKTAEQAVKDFQTVLDANMFVFNVIFPGDLSIDIQGVPKSVLIFR